VSFGDPWVRMARYCAGEMRRRASPLRCGRACSGSEQVRRHINPDSLQGELGDHILRPRTDWLEHSRRGTLLCKHIDRSLLRFAVLRPASRIA
jgi:hypothetical protein